MDVIQAARMLGKEIQADPRYQEYAAAKQANDEDIALQGLMGILRILQMSYQNESDKDEPDEAQLEKWDMEFRRTYQDVMLNENMRKFEEKKQAVDDLMNYIVNLLSVIVNGGDPDTAEPAPANGGGCTGSCSSCGGCG